LWSEAPRSKISGLSFFAYPKRDRFFDEGDGFTGSRRKPRNNRSFSSLEAGLNVYSEMDGVAVDGVAVFKGY